MVFAETLNNFPPQYFFVSPLNPPENMGWVFLVVCWAFLAMFCNLTLFLNAPLIIC